MHEHCSFCGELAGAGPPEVVRTAGVRMEWINPDWALCPSIGPMSSAHVLLVPRHHETFSLRCKGAARMIRLLARHFAKACLPRQVVLFEHANSSTGCGITHAHVHAVALTSPLAAEQVFSEIPLVSVNSLEALASERDELFWSLDVERGVLAAVGLRIESQSGRRAVGRANAVSYETDWKKYTDQPWYRTSLQTARLLAPLLREEARARPDPASCFESSAPPTID